MIDKRNFRRINFENSILLKFENDPEKVIEARLLDISFVGLSIFLKESASVGVIIQSIVQFDVPSSPEPHLIGTGKIVHLKNCRLYAQDGLRIGLEFIEVQKEIVLSIINRAELKNLEQIRKNSQILDKNPGYFRQN